MAPRGCVKTPGVRHSCVVGEDLSHLSANDRKQVELFQRFLRGERTHEIVAWALGEPMSSANDPESAGMGC